MAAWVDRLKQRPWVAHLVRTFERFGSRMGAQFGAAITYFSILGVIPLLMLGFSIAGFVLTISRPELLDPLATEIANALGSTDPATRERILSIIQNALRTFTAIGIVGVFSALYSGAGWMSNLKNAVRAQWRPDFDWRDTSGNIVTRTLLNLVELLGVVVAVVLTFVLASLSTNLTDNVLGLARRRPHQLAFARLFASSPSSSRSERAGCCFFTSTRSCQKPVSRGRLSGAAR